MSQRSLPGKPAELTTEWFTAIFREHALLTSGAVLRIQADIIGQDQGFTGVIARVHLQYTSREETAPSSVVVKIPTASRDMLSTYRAVQEKEETAVRRYFERCAREVAFYQQIAPVSVLPVPGLYYGAADSVTGRVILVLEDLRSMRLGDALAGCSPQDATLVIDQLARFHAQWWDHPQLETFSWLPWWGGDAQMAQDRYIQCLGPFLQRVGSHVPERIRKILDALATHYGAVRTRLRLAPATLIHADLHLDNILFSSPSDEPGLVLIDWQSVARGRGAVDLALFLFGSLETTTRRLIEDDLLQRYHQILITRGVTGYSVPQLREDCRLALLWLLGAKVVWLGSIDQEHLGEREQALVNASLSEDSFAGVLDHDAGSLLPL